MTYRDANEGQSTGEVCPACDREVILLAAEPGAELVECDCGRVGILSAA